MSKIRHTAAPQVGFPGPHVAIIMDGNGRWATSHGKSRPAGHEAGMRTAREITEAAVGQDIGVLTLYAFSSDNWKRPGAEVSALMRLFRRALINEAKRCLQNGVRLTIIGRRDRLPSFLLSTIDEVEKVTAAGHRMHLRIAMDYSSRDAMTRASALVRDEAVSREEFTNLLARVHNDHVPARDVDLVIRTGGEQRLSDFLLWESAYAELLFVAKMWPEFTTEDFVSAMSDFRSRNRRFGLAPEQVAS